MPQSPNKVSIVGALRIFLILFSTVLVGTSGLMTIEKWKFIDALYMAVITITTVGFQEVHPLSDGGRVFVMVYIVLGLGIALYCIGRMGELLVKSSVLDWLEKKRMGSEIKTMMDHFIVCGYGRMGQDIVSRLAIKGLPVVVIEKDEARLSQLSKNNGGDVSFIVGDATEDNVLKRAGIERAKGIATVLGGDADNLYVVLSSRLLNAKVHIVARSSSDNSIDKLYKAGADNVVSPYKAGAIKVAQLLANPDVAEIFESVTEGDKMELAEIRISQDSPYNGKYLSETDFRHKGLIIVAIRNSSGKLNVTPDPKTRIVMGDALVAFGKTEALDLALQRL